MEIKTAADILREELERRQRKNPAYSLRSFAQTLEIEAGTLSNILSGKRAVPRAKLARITERLALSPTQAEVLGVVKTSKKSLRELSRVKLRQKAPTLLNENHHKILAEWEHFAVLTLMETSNFKSSPSWIAKRIGVSKLRAEQILKRLEVTGLVSRKGTKLVRNFDSLSTPEDVVSSALQAAHRENLELAAQKLQDIPPEKRDYSSITMAIDATKLKEAKALVREFRKKLSAFLEDGERKSVYRLSIELFPLTFDSLEDT